MRVPRIVLVAAVCCMAAMSCYPDQMITSVSQLATVSTLVDSQAPLKQARTFALPDTVVHATRAQGAGVIGHEHDAVILAQIRENLIALGWKEITDVPAQTPDVVVLTIVLEFTNTGVAYSDWWGGWGWYPGWPAGFGPDWAWGYPGNSVTFTYETGTLAMVMLDTRHANTTAKRVPILWAGAVNGVLTSTSLQGALNGIDQAFAQSPYLERK